MLWGAAVLLRHNDVRDFDAADTHAALSACHPLLTNLRAINAGTRRPVGSRAAGVVVLDHRGEVESVSETADAWFGALRSSTGIGGEVPRVIYDVGLHGGTRASPAIRQLDRSGWAALSASRLDPDRTAVCIRTPTTTELVPTFALRRRLAPRETQILDLLIDGAASKHIARKLNLSLHTVDFHLGNLYRKSHVNSRDELLAQFTT
jgi:DNA-binding CsgD family transcriptional regulator